MKKTIIRLIPLLLIMVSSLGICAGCQGSSASSTPAVHLKIGVLPTISALPLYIADKEGYFKAENLDVELVNFNSALEQDAALQTNQIDGYFSDPVNAITMINGGVNIAIINSPYVASSKNRMFAILVSPKSGIVAAADLRGVEVGIANATITEYLLDRMLQSAGVNPNDIVGLDVKQIPTRLQLVTNGQIKAAVLPEPSVTMAESLGARSLIDDTDLDCPETVIALSNTAMLQDPALEKHFLQGLAKAAERINSDSGGLMTTAAAYINIPQEVQSTYKIPQFPVKVAPAQKQLDEIQTWMVQKQIIPAMLPFERLVK